MQNSDTTATVIEPSTDPWTATLPKSTDAPPLDAAFADLSDQLVRLITTIMEKESVTKADLAKRIGTSVANVSQGLKPGANLTLKTALRMFHAMGYTLDIRAEQL